MIDLHTHTLLSDGVLLPSELARRAEEIGYTAIAFADHADISNIDFVVPRLVKAAKSINKHWKIKAIPAVEITHAPLEEIKGLVGLARKLGAKIVVVHGETISEPVLKGTNRAAIEAKCDILSHPGYITKEDAALARKNGVCLEITTRRSHSKPDKHVFKTAKAAGAKMVLNTDTHTPDNLITDVFAVKFLRQVGATPADIKVIFGNSAAIVRKVAG